MKFGKNTTFIIMILFIISTVIALINLIGSSITNNKVQTSININNSNLNYIDKIKDNMYSSSNLTKDMIMSSQTGQSNRLLGQINVANSAAIFYGDSLKINMKEEEELSLYNNYLEQQKKYLSLLNLISENLNAGNTVGAINLNFSEYKSVTDNYFAKLKDLEKYYQKMLDDKLSSAKSLSNGIYYIQFLLLIVSIIGSVLSYLGYRTAGKMKLQEQAMKDSANSSAQV